MATKSDYVAAELARLYQRDGKLTAEGVVDEARSEDSPLHSHFEWDDEKAGHEYRLIQARRLLRVKVSPYVPGEEPSVLVNVPASKGEGEYHPASVVVTSDTMFYAALAEANRRLSAARDGVDELERAARGGDQPDRLARIALAAKGLEAATEAIRSLH